MPDSFEKSVKGGTKIKLAPPKSKYVEHILQATHAGDAGVAEIFRTMTNRLRDSTWTIVFKGLIIVHIMIREGEANVTLRHIADNPNKLAISSFNDAQDQGRNIRHYYGYILTRAKAYRDTKIDWVREGQGRLKKISVDKGLLRETEVVQRQVGELVKCDFLTEPENEITLTAFRLITMDLLKLYYAMNEGTMNVLEHYFEMSKTDAERALAIYRMFAKQTELVIEFLSVARMWEGATRLEIPKLKHAPTSLTQSLTDYLNDPDFEVNRRQYLAQQEAKRTGKPVKVETTNNSASKSGSLSSPTAQQAPAKGPAPDLIDLFGSIETNQQPMATQMFPPQQQAFQTGFGQPPQGAPGVNPFAAMVQQQNTQPNTSAAFNPFAPQGQPQGQVSTATGGQQFSPIQQQSMSPQQQLPPQQNFATGPNPFGQPQQQVQTGSTQSPFGVSPTQQQPMFGQPQQMQPPFGQQQQQAPAAALLPQQTSTNPFRQSMMPQATGSPSGPFAPTGQPGGVSTNPFAKNMNTGMPTIQESSSFNQQQPQQSNFFSNQPQQTSSPMGMAPSPPALQAQKTGTNPFARNVSPAQSLSPPAPLAAQATGSTNPFRQSQFVNQQTGQAWQNTPQGTIGGMDVNTFQSTPVFPRLPGAANPGTWPNSQT